MWHAHSSMNLFHIFLTIAELLMYQFICLCLTNMPISVVLSRTVHLLGCDCVFMLLNTSYFFGFIIPYLSILINDMNICFMRLCSD